MFYPDPPSLIRINPYGAELDEDVKHRALAATDATLASLVTTMRKHDLPADMLPTVARIYEQHVAAQGAKLANERQRDAPIFPMEIISKEKGQLIKCRPNGLMQVIEPTYTSYQIEEIVIDDAASWTIHDMTIGNKIQTVRSGSLSGAVFAAEVFQGKLKLEPCQRGMDLIFTASYVGNDPEGAVFRAKLRVRLWHPPVDPMFAIP